MANGVGLETAGMVLKVVVGLDTVSLVSANDMWTVQLGEGLDLLSSGIGMRVENADDIRDVFVRESRVLFA